jgi:hypothetical protein
MSRDPSEDSSAGKQRLRHISKQGNSLLRSLLVEAAQAAARIHPDWRRRSMHGDPSTQKHCEGSDAAQAGGSVVLDVAEWLWVFAVVGVRSVRGTARNRTPKDYEQAVVVDAQRSKKNKEDHSSE